MNITGRSCSKWCCRNPWCSLSSAFTPGFNQEAYESMGIFYIFFLSCIFLAVFWKKKKMHRCSLCAKLQHLLGRTSQRRECRHDIPIYIFFCFLHFYLNPDSFSHLFLHFLPIFPPWRHSCSWDRNRLRFSSRLIPVKPLSAMFLASSLPGTPIRLQTLALEQPFLFFSADLARPSCSSEVALGAGIIFFSPRWGNGFETAAEEAFLWVIAQLVADSAANSQLGRILGLQLPARTRNGLLRPGKWMSK